jgi:hypothetical protein
MITSIEDACYSPSAVITVALTHCWQEGQEVLVLVQPNYLINIERHLGQSFIAIGVTEQSVTRWVPC